MSTDHREPARVPYGFDLAPDEHRLLRSRPPRQALDWAARAVGSNARVASVQAIAGGCSSAVHALTIVDDQQPPHRVVLRRYVRPDVQAEEPDLAEREATVLGVLDAGPVTAPRLIAVDPVGDEAGVPAVLMTRLLGRIDWNPIDLDTFLVRLAAPLPAVHDITVPPGVTIQPYRPYELGKELGPPPWTRFPRAWARAVELYEGPPPSRDRRFIHRDYHPGNVLWSRQRVTGIVDWQSASLGSPEADVAHCRSNLVDHFSIAAADRFLAIWQSLSGRRDYHPYWDVTVVVAPTDAYGDPDPRLDEWIARTVSLLG